MREKYFFLCKNEKGRDFRQTSDAVVPEQSHKIFFFRNSPKFLTREENLSKLSAFFYFCSDNFAARGIFARKAVETSKHFGYSVVK